MAYFIALGVLAVVGIVATIVLVRTDGYGSVRVDPARVVEPDPEPTPAPAPRIDDARAATTRLPRLDPLAAE